jgi:hypothetical protein
MLGTDAILALAHAYGSATGASTTTISSRVFNDGKKLAAIEAGSDLFSGRLNRAVQWFSDNWPDGAEWPADVPRPATNPVAA